MSLDAPAWTMVLALTAAALGRAGASPSRRARPGRTGPPAPNRWVHRFGVHQPGRSWSCHRDEGRRSDELGRLRAAVASGGSVLQGFEAMAGGTGRWADEARVVVLATRRGRPLQQAVDAWAERAADPEVHLVADALAIGSATGGSHALGLQVAAEAAASRRALSREIRALAAQARASALLLVVTPIAFALAVAVLDHRVAAHLGSPGGLLTIACGLGLDAVGAAWMALLVGRVS